MARKKVTLAYIESRSDRKTTYKKRQKGFMKRAHELSTLCGAEMASVMYDPFQKGVVHVFPNPEDAIKTFKKFRALVPSEQSKNMMTTDEFMRKRTEKLKEQLRTLRKENTVKEMKNLMSQVLKGKMVTIDTNPDDVNDLLFVMRQEHERIRALRKNENHGEASMTSNASPSISRPMIHDRTSLGGPKAPLLAPIGGSVSMVHQVSSSLTSGRTNFDGPRVPLLVPNVSPSWGVRTMAPSARILRLQQLFQMANTSRASAQMANTSRASPQMAPHLHPSWIPPFSSFSSYMSSPMAPQIFSSSTSQQIDVRSTSVIAPQIPSTTMNISISSQMPSSPMYAWGFPPQSPQIDTSMNIPSTSMNFPPPPLPPPPPQNPPLSKSIDWNDDTILGLFDDSYLDNTDVEDSISNNNS